MADAAPPIAAFATRLRSLCDEHGTSIEHVGIAAYNPAVRGTSLGLLRKVLAGQRQPPITLMEAIADALNVTPMLFAEYELAQTRRLFDERDVGLQEAYENLQAFKEAIASATTTSPSTQGRRARVDTAARVRAMSGGRAGRA